MLIDATDETVESFWGASQPVDAASLRRAVDHPAKWTSRAPGCRLDRVGGRHRGPVPGLARRRGQLRGRRAATAAPAGHARRRRGDRTPGPPGDGGQRRSPAHWPCSAPSSVSAAGSCSVPRIEEAAGYRIDSLNVPWWPIAAGGLLAIVSAAGGVVAAGPHDGRHPPVLALSGRPLRPAPYRSAAVAGAFILGGVAALALAGDVMTDSGDPMPNWGNVLLVAAGTVATVVGVLLISPLAIRLLASGAARLPVAMRLASRPRPLPGPFRSRARRDQPRPRFPSPSSSPLPPPSTPPTPATSPTANCSSEPQRRLWTAAAARAGRRRRAADGGRPARRLPRRSERDPPRRARRPRFRGGSRARRTCPGRDRPTLRRRQVGLGGTAVHVATPRAPRRLRARISTPSTRTPSSPRRPRS